MTSQFEENLAGGEMSAHNHLAISVASLCHDVRFHGDNFAARLYCFCECGIQCSFSSMTRSYRRVFIKYDSEAEYDIPSTYRTIEFGDGKDYMTYPVRMDYHRLPHKVDQTVAYGKVRTSEQADQYIDTLCKLGGKILLANIGEKIYIIGGSPEATYAAVDTFISDILKSDTEGSFCFSSASAVVYRAEYRITSFTADGAELSDYTVLLSNRLPELILSKIDSLTAKIGSLYGIAPGKAYETDGKAFLIGTTDIYPEYASLMGDASSLFTVSDGKVVLLAESNYHLMKAIDQIMNDLEATEGAYTLSTGKNNCILEESSTLSSMSFNLYGTTDIEQRRGAVGTIIMKYLPDVLGIQEGKTEWLGYLNRQFSGIYASVGTGNSENGYTETYNNIYYNTAKFTLIEGGTFWLSDTPDVPGTKFSSSKRVRTATYAVLELKKDGSRILYVNTHLDNLSETPRLEQLEVLLGFIDKYDYPTVITGDFNSNMTSNVYRKITAGKTFTTHRVLLDSREVAAEAYKYGTYNGLKPGGTGILDYCFVSDGDFNVSLYRVNTELVNEVYPSDHNSVYIEYTLLK